MVRPRISQIGDPLTRIDIMVPTSMKQQLISLNVNISAIVRGYLSEYLNSGPCEDVEIRKELEELEPKVLLLKARAEELDKRKQTAMSEDNEKQAKLNKQVVDVAGWIKKHGADAYKMKEYVAQHAESCGLSLDDFRAEVEKQYPGMIENVYRDPVSRRRQV